MGWGKYQVAADLHVVVGSVEVDLPAGEFTPSTEDEYLACKQYVGVSFRPAGADKSQVLVDQIEGPGPAAGNEPPANPAQTAGTSPAPAPPTSSQELADAEAELAKAEADVKAAGGAAGPAN